MMHDKRNRLGEKRVMRCGIEATITEYRCARDITIRFPNGREVKTTWQHFVNGNVACPVGIEMFEDYAQITIPSCGTQFLIDLEHLDVVKDRMWTAEPVNIVGRRGKYALRYIRNNGIGFLARYIMDAPDDYVVQYKNYNWRDLRKSNLFLVRRSEFVSNNPPRRQKNGTV